MCPRVSSGAIKRTARANSTIAGAILSLVAFFLLSHPDLACPKRFLVFVLSIFCPPPRIFRSHRHTDRPAEIHPQKYTASTTVEIHPIGSALPVDAPCRVSTDATTDVRHALPTHSAAGAPILLLYYTQLHPLILLLFSDTADALSRRTPLYQPALVRIPMETHGRVARSSFTYALCLDALRLLEGLTG